MNPRRSTTREATSTRPIRSSAGSAPSWHPSRPRPRRRSDAHAERWVSVAPTVLFIRNEHLATEAMLGDAFTESGFDVETFTVVPPESVDEPDVEVVFPDP